MKHLRRAWGAVLAGLFFGQAQADTLRLETRLPTPPAIVVSKTPRPESPADQALRAWQSAAHLLEQGRAREALTHLETVLARDPTHAAARQTLIVLALESRQFERSSNLLEEGAKLHPKDPWYPRALAHLALQQDDLARALNHLKTGLTRPVDAAYWAHYAALLSRDGQHSEAAQAYRQATQLAPNHGVWWIGLGVALERAAAPEEALAAFQRALRTELSPELRAFVEGRVKVGSP